MFIKTIISNNCDHIFPIVFMWPQLKALNPNSLSIVTEQ